MSSHLQYPLSPGGLQAQLTDLVQRHLRAARIEAFALPDLDNFSLFLLNRDFSTAALSAEEMAAVMEYPAYWCFCWASGLALAQLLAEQPQWVAGRRVLDFGCGSGVVAIAAAKAGASRVVACDLDPDALLATQINAAFNSVRVELCDDIARVEGEFDLVIVADVLYDKANFPWLDQLLAYAPEVLVADSRVRDFSHPHYRQLEQRRGTTLPDLDAFDEFRDVRLYLGLRAEMPAA